MNREDRLNIVSAIIMNRRSSSEVGAVDIAKQIETAVQGIIRRENQTEHLGDHGR